MIAAILLQAQTVPPVPDWSGLAPMPYAAAPAVTPTLSAFVANEIAAGRCAVARPGDAHYVIRVEIAALVSGDGMVRRAVPHAIGCPTVEQYAAGLLLNFARGNLVRRASVADTWYHATIVFDWQG